MQGVTLTFPAGFDPFNLPSEEVQRTVQNLWIEAANRELAEAVADAVSEDYATLTPEDLPPTEHDINIRPVEVEDCRRCAGYGVIESRSAGTFRCDGCNGTGKVPASEFSSRDALRPPPDNG